ncbi:uncharacterized protein LOC109604449 isoform X2 [Aethina tumida]|uniref:uncharacterized protein LOC109604449 isoform X2 n=1 Tax=Aethina tumida TaxID=116153 RepID=UPI002147A32E|nr:uncharacterized protein LOC109604449 isoform X2 [Aethina tumida]
MALQLHKIPRNLIQNGQRLWATTTETLSRNFHSEGNFPQAVATAPEFSAEKSLPSHILSEGQIRTYASRKPGCKQPSCPKMNKCPKFYLKGCSCPKCEPKKKLKCTKREAPYPAYSEACVEELAENPSECVQCPWRYCPNFKPKNRGFHQKVEATQQLQQPQYGDSKSLQSIFLIKKKPCERPPSICEKQRKLRERQKEEQKKKDCEDSLRTNKKKAMDWSEIVRMWYYKRNPHLLGRDDIFLHKKRNDHDAVREDDPQTYEAFEYDPREADLEHKRKRRGVERRPPHCGKGRRNKPVKDCPPGCGRCSAAPLPINETMRLAPILDALEMSSPHPPCPPRKKKCPKVDYSKNFCLPALRYQYQDPVQQQLDMDGPEERQQVLAKDERDGEPGTAGKCQNPNCFYYPCTHPPCKTRKAPYNKRYHPRYDEHGNRRKYQRRPLKKPYYDR